VSDALGQKLTIANVAIQGSSVVVTLAADPGAISVHVGYALTQEGMGNQGGTDLGLRGLLRDSDELNGWDAETIAANVTSGSAVVTSADPNGFVRRAGHDVVTGPGVPQDTVVKSHDTDSQVTLSAGWPGPTGAVMLRFRHDERNYCVHFSLYESAAPAANARYVLVNRATGWALDINGGATTPGAPTFQWPVNQAKSQRWVFQPASGGAFVLSNVNSGLALDVPGAAPTPGTAIDQATASGGANQQWKLQPAATAGYYLLVSNAGSLVATSPSSTVGDHLVVEAQSADSPSQEWQLVAF
jgi:hypothetical protein